YNAARHDAEAGRNERAAELARAAEALTHVPRLLPGLRQEDEDDGAVPAEDAARDVEGERTSDGDDADDDDADDHDAAQGSDESGSIVGIGAALTFEDGTLRILEMVPGSPAAQSEDIQPGDILVGIEPEDG